MWRHRWRTTNDRRIGVLLAQLGTPDAPTPAALRRYLRQFLSDRRVVERNRVLWWFVLRLLVLPRRPRRSAALYRRIWSRDGSPLLVISRSQARALEAELNRHEPERFKVALGMRYGSPSIASAVQELLGWGADRLLLFPLYPQYAGATTGSTYDEVFRQLSMLRFVPALRVVPPYYAHAAYIEALAQSVREAMAPLPRPPDKIIISFHGIPQRFVDSGDPVRVALRGDRAVAGCTGRIGRMAPTCFPINRAPAGSRGCVRTRTRPSSNWHGPVFAMSW